MKTIKLAGLIFLISFFMSCEEQKIDVDKFGTISGTILNGDDYSPLPGVLITTSPASSTALTDEQGKFEFPKVSEGEVAVTARKKDFLGNSVSVSVYENETTALTFYLLKDEKNVGWVTIYDPVPGNGAVDQNTSFTLQWKVDQENRSKTLDYTVFVFESNSTTQQIAGENLSTTQVVVSGLKHETTYYWYVVAKYEGSNVANSPTWTFKTAAENN